MTISQEQAEEIKDRLLKQLENFPEDKRDQITEQINSMTTEQLEQFIQQNKLAHLEGNCIFCSIASGETQSYKIAEDSSFIAILELNPLSKGHVLIVPKQHLDKIPDTVNPLMQQVKNKLKEKFSPNEIKINEIQIMGHALLELIPIYGNETERHKASEKELQSLQEEILKPSRPPQQTIETKQTETIPILRPRIPRPI